MAKCLIKDLKVLKKSSKEAVMGLEEITGFKDYLHIERNIEQDLFNKVESAYENDKSKLILVCGSVGDGKSHLLSILKNRYPKISDKFIFHNDATESRNPKKTFEDTLKELLNPFNDDNYNNNNSKILLAINLGTLHNFMKSEQSNNFGKLKCYLKQLDLINNYDVKEDEYFKEFVDVVDFNEYELFQFKGNNLKSPFIERILEKIIKTDKNNIIKNSYLSNCINCSNFNNCPVKYNYEVLLNNNFREYLTECIIKYIIKFKKIISVRELLDFIFNILVPNELENDYNKNFKKIKKFNFDEENFLEYLTFNLTFNEREVSSKFNRLSELDPLNIRNSLVDRSYENYRIDSELFENYKNKLNMNYHTLKKHITNKSIDEITYQILTKTIIRNTAMLEDNSLFNEEIYQDYIEKLYVQNISKEKKKLKELYKKVENAILNWNGMIESDPNIFIGRKQEEYNFTKELQIQPKTHEFKNSNELKFNKMLKIRYRNSKHKDFYSVSIDYKLYELIYKISKGYLPNKNDKDSHVNFDKFVNNLIGKNANKIYVYKMNSPKKYELIEDSFGGYEFNEVK